MVKRACFVYSGLFFRLCFVSHLSQTHFPFQSGGAAHPLIPAAIWVRAGGRGGEGEDPGGGEGEPFTAAAANSRRWGNNELAAQTGLCLARPWAEEKGLLRRT